MLEGKKTFTGVVVILLSMILSEYMSADEIQNLALILVQLLGLGIVIFGRLRAKKIYVNGAKKAD